MYKKLRFLEIRKDIKEKKDPISRYNLVVEQYNDPVNRNQEIFLSKAYNNSFYKLWYTLQSKCLVGMLLIYFVPYVSLLSILLNLIMFIIHIFAVRTYTSNKKKVLDPLENMIYDPILCKRGSADYLYFEILIENIESFKFDQEVVKKIIQRSEQSYDGKIRFMVYSNPFLAGFENLTNANYITFIHLFLNIMIFFVIQFYVYDRLLGLKLFTASN